MSIQLMSVVRYLDIKPTGRKFVLFALADFADDEGACYPGIERLARYTGQSESSVRRHLEALEAAGYFRRVRTRNSAGLLGQYRYFLTLDQGAWEAVPLAQSAGENHPPLKMSSGDAIHRSICAHPPLKMSGHNRQTIPYGIEPSYARGGAREEIGFLKGRHAENETRETGSKPDQKSARRAKRRGAVSDTYRNAWVDIVTKAD